MFGEFTLLKVLLAAVLVVVVSVLSLGIYLALKFWPRGADVPMLKTPAWALKDFDEYHWEFMLRRETTAGGALLIKRTDLETVYRYDPQERSLNAVGDTEWQKAGGPIAKCFDYRTRKPARDVMVTQNDRDHQLLIGKPNALREVPTAGGYPLQNEVSPSGRWVAVLSGTGPAIPSLSPFSGEFILGQRYHEILSLPDTQQVSKPIRFPVRDIKAFFNACWSADEEFVVHTHWQYTDLVVIPTGVSSR
ncbi:MAG TPA: hypothetical protein VJR02_30065 [Pyrinomonadaceae bacterium]|nr:hypothetical protein [Pyrinomonadaceae bacterium]